MRIYGRSPCPGGILVVDNRILARIPLTLLPSAFQSGDVITLGHCWERIQKQRKATEISLVYLRVFGRTTCRARDKTLVTYDRILVRNSQPRPSKRRRHHTGRLLGKVTSPSPSAEARCHVSRLAHSWKQQVVTSSSTRVCRVDTVDLSAGGLSGGASSRCTS